MAHMLRMAPFSMEGAGSHGPVFAYDYFQQHPKPSPLDLTTPLQDLVNVFNDHIDKQHGNDAHNAMMIYKLEMEIEYLKDLIAQIAPDMWIWRILNHKEILIGNEPYVGEVYKERMKARKNVYDPPQNEEDRAKFERYEVERRRVHREWSRAREEEKRRRKAQI
jgi:hypothetical protein